MSKEERNTKILAIVVIIAVLFLGVYKIFFDKKIVEEDIIDTKTISVLKDNSKFYTVSSVVSKYLSYLSIRDTENLLILLSNNYKLENNIDSNNIYNFLGLYDGVKTFSPKKMYQQRLSKTVYKYYVKGYLEEESISNVSNKEDFYLIVILDEKNMTFEIEPYDGSLFK